MHHEPVLNQSGEPVIAHGAEGDAELNDSETNELQPLVSTHSHARTPSPSPGRKIFNLFSSTARHSHSNLLLVSPATPFPVTPISNDGVFTNIPAKPSSSRECIVEDEELGEDEWIFMTSEQRRKLAPPKYHKVKRDRAPRYTTEYAPPPITVSAGSLKSRRRHPQAVRPRVNSLPAGSSKRFIVAAVICTLFPFLGYWTVYLANRGRWGSHAMRLGSRMGLGLGLFHVGGMIFYIPALLPPGFLTISVQFFLFMLWTALVGIPFGWRVSRCAVREYSWLKAEERVLLERVVQANLVVASDNDDQVEGEGNEEDIENGHRYIEGTDIRVRDLKKILARARDARLARSLRAAGF